MRVSACHGVSFFRCHLGKPALEICHSIVKEACWVASELSPTQTS